MNQPDFVVKCYNKQDLAQMYFPDITVRASVNKLRRWMRRCQPLMDEILSTDFHPKTKAFSVREVRLITYYLGKPGDFVTPKIFFYSFNKKIYGRQALSPFSQSFFYNS